MLQDNLEINFVIKLNAIEYIKIFFNNTKLLDFILIRATQQAFDNLSLYCIYNRYCLKYTKQKI